MDGAYYDCADGEVDVFAAARNAHFPTKERSYGANDDSLRRWRSVHCHRL